MPDPRKDPDGLNPQRRRFVEEYLVDLQATAAAIRAGYSKKSAQQQGYQLLQDSSVAAAIAKGKAKQLEKTELSAVRILEELRRLALFDVRTLFDADGVLKPVTAWGPEQGAAVAGLEVLIKNAQAGDGHTDTVHKVKLWDKTKALNDLARHFALLTDVVQVSGDVALLEKIGKARERGAALLAERKKK